MSRYAIVNSECQVENVIIFEPEGEFPLPEGWSLVALEDRQPCGPGYTYAESEFVPAATAQVAPL